MGHGNPHDLCPRWHKITQKWYVNKQTTRRLEDYDRCVSSREIKSVLMTNVENESSAFGQTLGCENQLLGWVRLLINVIVNFIQRLIQLSGHSHRILRHRIYIVRCIRRFSNICC